MQPFLGSAAVRGGLLTRRQLDRSYRPVYRDVYLHNDVELTAALRARAAHVATGSTLCGLSAAAMFGAKWLDPAAPAEIVRADRHTRAGIVVRTWTVAPDEVCLVASIRCTTPVRTAFDIGRSRPVDEAVPVLDALLSATRIKPTQVLAVARRYPGARGVARLRTVLDLVDGGAESPPESRLRLLLMNAGLPRPETQIEFHELRIRVDLGWRQWKVAVEYDGVQHWADRRQRAWDIERIALLEAAGWAVVRVSSVMLAHPERLVERVRAKLRAAGCPV